MTQPARTRRRGRELEEAIFQAVWDELRDGGFSAVTMDNIAKRAGTSKPVLYRRWPGRVSLIVATAVHFSPTAESIPDTGALRDDTIALLGIMRVRMLTLGRETILGILTEVSENPEVNEQVFRKLIGHIREIMVGVVLRRALERGEIAPEQLNERLQTLPVDLARNEFLLTGNFPDESIEEIVDTVFLPALAGRALGR